MNSVNLDIFLFCLYIIDSPHMRLIKTALFQESAVEVKTSTVNNAGQGLFALCDLPKSKTFCIYAGKKVTAEASGEYVLSFTEAKNCDAHYVFECPELFINGKWRRLGSNFGRFVNDARGPERAKGSKQYNCEYDTENPHGPFKTRAGRSYYVCTLTTTKHVKKGDELFIDYGDEYWLADM